MGFDGTSVTPHIRTLIEEHHVGCILLTAKNLKCEEHVLSCDLVRVPNATTNLLQPPKTRRSSSMSCKRLLMMPVIRFHWRLALTRRTAA